MSEENHRYQYLIDAYNNGIHTFRMVSVGKLLIWIDELRAENARLTALVERLKEDAERLASTYVIEVFPHEWVCRGGCHHWARFGEQIEHSPDCPIALHRALMKELE